ncbi:MAG: helix-turn-helix domain-containing protein [bacterium]
MKYSYPGNVRELENAIEHAFALCKQEQISTEHLPRGITDFSPSQEIQARESGYNPLMLAEAEEIQRTLKKHDGNRLLAAKELGLHRISPATAYFS